MGWCARLAAAFLIALFGWAGGAAAHEGGTAYILVPADFILPGQPFEVVAVDMGPGARVTLEIVHEPTVASLGTTTAAPDGHLVSTLLLPANFPTGYAQLFATSVDGLAVSTWVLVGQRTVSTPPPPDAGAWWTDPSVLVLLVFVIGAVAVVGYLLLRPRRRNSLLVGGSRGAATQRRAGTRKSRR